MRITLFAVLACLALAACDARPAPPIRPGDPTPGAANPETGSRPGSGGSH